MFSKSLFHKPTTTLLCSLILVASIFAQRSVPSIAHAGSEPPKVEMQADFQNEDYSTVISIAGDRGNAANIRLNSSASKDSLNRDPASWKTWDVIPSLSPVALSIYRTGLATGNNPRAFSKVGDGEISAAWFLTEFDSNSEAYDLGPYTGLQTTIDFFAGSFSRQGMAAHRGFNVQRVLDPALADPKLCLFNETPLDCEIRLHRPSFTLISMGTNQVWQPREFEAGMREIIAKLIAQGVVPVLSTKADNLDGDDRINLTIARLAAEYDLPLWNFWRVVQPLPDHGLQRDKEHLTYYPNRFSNPASMQFAWPVRNLSALQLLERLMKETQQ